jgi:hypothetical protein
MLRENAAAWGCSRHRLQGVRRPSLLDEKGARLVLDAHQTLAE